MVFSVAVAVSPARAVDTTNSWFSTIPGAPAVTFYDAEWSPDGQHCMFVGYDTTFNYGAAWWYDPMDNSWLDVSITTGEGDGFTFQSVEFCGDRMVVMGNCGVSGRWFYTDIVTHYLTYADDADLADCQVYDIQYIGGSVFAAGRAALGHAMTWYLPGGTNWEAGWGDSEHVSGSCYYGIDWYSWGADVVTYMVGWWNDAGTTRGLYQKYNVTPMSMVTVHDTFECAFTDIELDTSDSVAPRMLITAEGRGTGVSGIYAADTQGGETFHHLTPLASMPAAESFYGIDVDQYGTAVFVGNDPAYGLVYSLYRSSTSTVVVKRSDTGGMFVGAEFHDVRIRPGGVQMAITVGSAFKYSYTSVLAPIQVDTALPHISYLDLYPATDPSMHYLNHQVDVDAGTGATQYTLSVCVWDSLGIDRVTAMNIWMWYDMGLTGADAPAVFDDAALANQRIRFAANNGAAPTMPFPATGETSFIGGTWEESGVYAWVNVTFSPQQQVRWADSTGGVWNQGSGTDYRFDGDVSGTWNAEDQSDNAGFAPLDEALTWDIKVQIQDDAAVTNYARAYDEFGLYKYTYLGSENIPNGGSVYGSGAPSTLATLAPSNVDVTFCANCPYSLGVTLHSDLAGVAGPDVIPSTDISLQGGDLALTAFGAAPSTRILIGGGPLQQPLGSGITTTTSSYDGNADSDAVFWWCDIPAVAEDQYIAQITWALNN
jgi:hypothetical protein